MRRLDVGIETKSSFISSSINSSGSVSIQTKFSDEFFVRRSLYLCINTADETVSIKVECIWVQGFGVARNNVI